MPRMRKGGLANKAERLQVKTGSWCGEARPYRPGWRPLKRGPLAREALERAGRPSFACDPVFRPLKGS